MKYFERAYVLVDDVTYSTTWTMEDVKDVAAQFELRSAVECAILCKWASNCIAWQANILEEKYACLHLSSYE